MAQMIQQKVNGLGTTVDHVQIRKCHSEMNALIPIARLPDEVLYEMFSLAKTVAEDEYSLYNSLYVWKERILDADCA